jgi:mannitol/fructose-specific phosphotransferase system IIA component (Ntr-type)
MKGEELLRLFDPKLCIFELQSHTKDDALREIVSRVVPDDKSSTRVTILEMLRNREALGSTAVGKGVAFPHGRSLAVSKLMAVFARSTRGIDFDSTDSEPTYLFFVLLAPPQDRANQYLPALGRIIETVQDDLLRDRLLKVTTFEEFAAVMKEG